jgi:hypothetical protein
MGPHSPPGLKVYGYVVYQRRITMIRRRDPSHYGENSRDILTTARESDRGNTSLKEAIEWIVGLRVFMIESALCTLLVPSLPDIGLGTFFSILALSYLQELRAHP